MSKDETISDLEREKAVLRNKWQTAMEDADDLLENKLSIFQLHIHFMKWLVCFFFVTVFFVFVGIFESLGSETGSKS